MNIRPTPQEDLLGISGLVTTKVDRDSYPDELFVHAAATRLKSACPHCQTKAADVHGHGSDKGHFKDVGLHGRKTTIVLTRARWRCTVCGKTWIQKVTGLHERRMMTTRLEEEIAKRSFRGTFMEAAREYGIDEGTVRNILAADKDANSRPQTPEVLGIDEIHLADVPCVLTDVRNRLIFDILPSQRKEAIAPYFASLPDKGNIKVVVADMWRPYHDIADTFLPGRLVVVDRFHVVRMANRGFDNVRKIVGRSLGADERIRLKNERDLLNRRRKDLTDRQRDLVDSWLASSPALRHAYTAKERFAAVYNAGSRHEAAMELGNCLRAIPSSLDQHFAELITACGNWRERILNYFEDPVTNGYTESVNSVIRELDRAGRGYSFETMRALMLYDDTDRSKKTSTRSRRARLADDAIGFFGIDLDDDDFDLELTGRFKTPVRSLDRIARRLAAEPDPIGDED